MTQKHFRSKPYQESKATKSFTKLGILPQILPQISFSMKSKDIKSSEYLKEVLDKKKINYKKIGIDKENFNLLVYEKLKKELKARYFDMSETCKKQRNIKDKNKHPNKMNQNNFHMHKISNTYQFEVFSLFRFKALLP